MSGHHAARYCAVYHLQAFTAWLVARGFETVEMNEQDEFYRARRGKDLICVMPRQGGKRFAVNISQQSWLDQFKKTLQQKETG